MRGAVIKYKTGGGDVIESPATRQRQLAAKFIMADDTRAVSDSPLFAPLS